jgi:hypothetical protein
VNAQDLTEVVGAIGLFALVITVITTIVKQVGATTRAKAALAREQEYRRLAETAVRAQDETERRLAGLSEGVGQMQDRLASIERVLKQVE